MIIDCVSDLHGHYPELQGGDLLIIAGDFCKNDSTKEIVNFQKWLWEQEDFYKKIICIAGNHDNFIQEELEKGYGFSWNNEKIEFLLDSDTEFTIEEDDEELERCGIHPTIERTFKIWGSPWTKTFEGMNPACKAFTVDTEEELAEKWALIPDDIDILITHSPTYSILDKTVHNRKEGCPYLYEWFMMRGRPKLHVFGHIHESYGTSNRLSSMISVNASHVNERYEPVNKPVRIEL